jgi:hypothetical protein
MFSKYSLSILLMYLLIVLNSVHADTQTEFFSENWEYDDTNVENAGYQIGTPGDENAFVNITDVAAINGSKGLEMHSTPVYDRTSVRRLILVPIEKNLKFSFYVRTLATAPGSFELHISSIEGNFVMWYNDPLPQEWDTTHFIFRISTTFDIKNLIYFERNIQADLNSALEHMDSPFESFSDPEIDGFEIFQTPLGVEAHHYFDEIRFFTSKDPCHRKIIEGGSTVESGCALPPSISWITNFLQNTELRILIGMLVLNVLVTYGVIKFWIARNKVVNINNDPCTQCGRMITNQSFGAEYCQFCGAKLDRSVLYPEH